ncbi:MAG: hypothetical protein F2667_01705 [Actinobacteria bacterium]|uniref:Unannotated protein n=1 Tax=freshwater metagenome TaxID=449393 RepID=A0A6J6NSJ1_9ZZZZ|nr:hypothetical protein [Actinomycetota bacterium]
MALVAALAALSLSPSAAVAGTTIPIGGTVVIGSTVTVTGPFINGEPFTVVAAQAPTQPVTGSWQAYDDAACTQESPTFSGGPISIGLGTLQGMIPGQYLRVTISAPYAATACAGPVVDVVVPKPPTVSITGLQTVGSTLVATVTAATPSDGTTYAITWQRRASDGSTWTDLASSAVTPGTAAQYKLVPATAGQVVRAIVRATFVAGTTPSDLGAESNELTITVPALSTTAPGGSQTGTAVNVTGGLDGATRTISFGTGRAACTGTTSDTFTGAAYVLPESLGGTPLGGLYYQVSDGTATPSLCKGPVVGAPTALPQTTPVKVGTSIDLTKGAFNTKNLFAAYYASQANCLARTGGLAFLSVVPAGATSTGTYLVPATYNNSPGGATTGKWLGFSQAVEDSSSTFVNVADCFEAVGETFGVTPEPTIAVAGPEGATPTDPVAFGSTLTGSVPLVGAPTGTTATGTWQRSTDSGRTWTDIRSTETLRVLSTDAGAWIRYAGTFKLSGYYDKTGYSEHVVVAPRSDPASPAPFLSGRPVVGTDLTFVDPLVDSFLWKFWSDSSCQTPKGASYGGVAGGPGYPQDVSLITPTETQLGLYISVTASVDGRTLSQPCFGPIVSLMSGLTVQIFGTAKVGDVLSATTSGPTVPGSGATTTVQWFREGSAVAIATGRDYLVTSADLGKTLTARATATATGFADLSASAATVSVLARDAMSGPVDGTAIVSGTLKVGEILTVRDPSGPARSGSFTYYSDGDCTSQIGTVPLTQMLGFSKAIPDKFGDTAVAGGFVRGAFSSTGETVVAGDCLGPIAAKGLPFPAATLSLSDTPTANRPVSGTLGGAAVPVGTTYVVTWSHSSSPVVQTPGTGTSSPWTFTPSNLDVGQVVGLKIVLSAPGYEDLTLQATTSLPVAASYTDPAATSGGFTGTTEVGVTLKAALGSSTTWKLFTTADCSGSPVTTSVEKELSLTGAMLGQYVQLGDGACVGPVQPGTLSVTLGVLSDSGIVGSATSITAPTVLPAPILPGSDTVTYEWFLTDSLLFDKSDLDDPLLATPLVPASDGTYTPAVADKGKWFAVRVTVARTGYRTYSDVVLPQGPIAFPKVAGVSPVTVSGDPKVGQVLTATLAGVIDSSATLSYQWYELTSGGAIPQTGTPIASATSASWTVQGAYATKQVYVVVTATQDLHAETVAVSAPTSTLAAGSLNATGPALLTQAGPAVPGTVLSATAPTVQQSDTSVSYVWSRQCGPVASTIPDQSLSTYALTAADQGCFVSVTMTVSKTGYVSIVREKALSEKVLGVFAHLDPRIVGTPQVGGLLSVAGQDAVTPQPASVGGAFAYQWFVDGRPVVGQTRSVFVPRPEDLGRVVTVQVVASAPGYQDLAGRAAAEPAVLPGVQGPVTVLALTGAIVGAPIVTSVAAPASATLTYQWFRIGVLGDAAVPGATSSTYTPTVADLGSTFRMVVTAAEAGYGTRTATVIVGPVKQPALGPFTATISGATVSGTTLTASLSPSVPADAAVAWVWSVDGVTVPGVTGSVLPLSASMVGGLVSATATVTRVGNDTVTASAGPVGPVVRPTLEGLAVTIGGQAQVWSRLTAVVTPSTPPVPVAGLSWQWYADGVAIPGATGAVLRLVREQIGARITVRVTGLVEGYETAVATSQRTAPVAGVPVEFKVARKTARPGESVVSRGSGYLPGDVVELKFGSRVLGTAVADDNGRFEAGLVIPVDVKVFGDRKVKAVLGDLVRFDTVYVLRPDEVRPD